MQSLSAEAEEFIPGVTYLPGKPMTNSTYQLYPYSQPGLYHLPQQYMLRTTECITPQTICVPTHIPYQFKYVKIYTPTYYYSPVPVKYINNYSNSQMYQSQSTNFHNLPNNYMPVVDNTKTYHGFQHAQTLVKQQSDSDLVNDDYVFTLYFEGTECYVENESSSNEFLYKLIVERLSSIWSPPEWIKHLTTYLSTTVELTVDENGYYRNAQMIDHSTNVAFDEIVNYSLSKYITMFSIQNIRSSTLTSGEVNSAVSNISENKEAITLIWYGEKIDDIYKKLRSINNYILVYSEFEKAKCIGQIRSVLKEKIFLIVSSVNESDILFGIEPDASKSLPRQIDSIFIYRPNGNKDLSTMSLQHQRKLVDVFQSIDELLNSVIENKKCVEKQTAVFSLYNTSRKYVHDVESADYQWKQLISDILVKIPLSDGAKKQMLEKCQDYYRDNKTMLRNIEDFRINYIPQKTINWYTKQDFVYKLVNKALLTEDPDGLILFRFLISELCRQIKAKHELFIKTPVCPILRVYRGVIVPEEIIDEMAKLSGKLVSTPSFLSTSRNKKVAEMFADVGNSSKKTNEKVSVIYAIQVNIRIESIVFADISEDSDKQDEEGVLFNPGAVFKIESVIYVKSSNYWLVRMTAFDKDEIIVSDYINECVEDVNTQNQKLISIASVLIDMNEGKKAHTYLENLLRDHQFDKKDEAHIYNLLGCSLDTQLRYNESFSEVQKEHLQSEMLKCFLISYRLYMELNDKHESDILLKNIVLYHLDHGDFDRAMCYALMALSLKRKLYRYKPQMYINELEQIANIYHRKNDLDQALHCYEHILRLRRNYLLKNKYACVNTLIAIGDLHCFHTGYVYQALDYYTHALKISTSLNDSEFKIQLFSKISHLHLAYFNKTDLALKYKMEQLNEEKKIRCSGDPHMVNCLIEISAIMLKQNHERPSFDENDVDSAMKYAIEGLNAAKKSYKADIAQIARYLQHIGSLYNHEHKWTKAEMYLLEAFHLCKNSQLHDKLCDEIANLLMEVSEHTGNKLEEVFVAIAEGLRQKQIEIPSKKCLKSTDPVESEKLNTNSNNLNKNDVSMLLMLSQNVDNNKKNKTIYNKHKFIRNQLQNTQLDGECLSGYAERQLEDYRYYTKHPFEQSHTSKYGYQQGYNRGIRDRAPLRPSKPKTLESSLLTVMCLCNPALSTNVSQYDLKELPTINDIWCKLSDNLQYLPRQEEISYFDDVFEYDEDYIYDDVADTRGIFRRHHMERVKRRRSQKIGNRPLPTQQIQSVGSFIVTQYNGSHLPKKNKNLYSINDFLRAVSETPNERQPIQSWRTEGFAHETTRFRTASSGYQAINTIPFVQWENIGKKQYFPKKCKKSRETAIKNRNLPMRRPNIKKNFNYFRSRRLC
ncbi:hypothetical protein I4U23_010906 [Adineta vaga]|nr:hypothetical protein I4U23_010906 [Adineta vaga]